MTFRADAADGTGDLWWTLDQNDRTFLMLNSHSKWNDPFGLYRTVHSVLKALEFTHFILLQAQTSSSNHSSHLGGGGVEARVRVFGVKH